MLNSPLVQGSDVIEPAQGIKDASLKEDWAWSCSDEQSSPCLFVALPARMHMDPRADSVRACGDLE
jgi:hypothetical protein